MTVSLWLDEPYRPRAALQGEVAADVAIVGAGMTGASLAWFLREQGNRIVLIERGVVAGGASGRNAGFVITGLGEHYASSIRTYGQDGARTIWRTNLENADLVARLVKEAGIDCAYRRRGSLTLAASEAEWDELTESARLAAGDGFPGRLIEPAEANARLHARGFHGALEQPHDGEIHPARFVRGLVQGAEREGVRVFEGTDAERIEAAPSGLRVRTPRGTVSAGRVVIATNAYARSLHPFLRERTFPVRGQVLATDVVNHPGFDVPVYGDHGYDYWRGFGGRAIMGGRRPADRGAEDTDEDAANPRIQAALEGFMGAHFPGIRFRVTHRWSGTMCFSADGLPIIGPLPGLDGVFTSVGYTGHGFGYAEVAARWLAGMLRGGRDDVPALFRPDRTFEPHRRPS